VQRVYTLSNSAGVQIHDVHCSEGCGGAGAEEMSERHEVVLPRRGVFVRHVGGRRLVADANHALFFKRGEAYRVSHPLDGGDACTVVSIEARRLCEICSVLDPRAADEECPRLPDVVRTSSQVDRLHRRLLLGLQQGDGALAMEETVLELVATLLGLGMAPQLAPARRRSSTRARHSEIVERTCIELARRLDAKLELESLSCAVHSSPYHLSRLFRAHTGWTLHRYHERLRLHAALDRIREGPCELTQLALDLGFSHHSHFTNRFRREFGLVPSACRTPIGSRHLRRSTAARETRVIQ
jgi:AraC-like DNA-binding protein